MTAGLIILFGIYIMAHGHVSIGGGLAGGIIIALSFILLVIAFGKDVVFKKINQNAASVFESLSALILITLAILGIGSGYVFFNFLWKGTPFKLFSSGLIPLYNLLICFKAASGFFIVFLVIVLLKISKKEGGR
jgi:multisubunit Na+/H+ antiporter MnhB subunit